MSVIISCPSSSASIGQSPPLISIIRPLLSSVFAPTSVLPLGPPIAPSIYSPSDDPLALLPRALLPRGRAARRLLSVTMSSRRQVCASRVATSWRFCSRRSRFSLAARRRAATISIRSASVWLSRLRTKRPKGPRVSPTKGTKSERT
eukprot:1176269-Prorocentrum_minimum.AAC.1